MKVEVSRLAAIDAAAIRRYLEKKNQTAAVRFVEELNEPLGWTGSNPKLVAVGYRKIGKGDVRMRTIPRFESYVVYFVIRSDAVRVLRIAHGAQDWKRLLKEAEDDA
jgi:plasmid stabilization system protein ParE